MNTWSVKLLMDKLVVQRKVTVEILLEEVKRAGRRFVPAGVSARHVHLDKAALQCLFGEGHCLVPVKDLSQPGQFACAEQIIVEGPKGRLQEVRVLGPERSEVQVELSVTDALALGVTPVLRMSGDIWDTPGVRLIGPAGMLAVKQGVIVAARHLHISPGQAEIYGLMDGEVVRARSTGSRSVLFDEIVVRCGAGHDLDLHVDFDEANAAMIKSGDFLEIV